MEISLFLWKILFLLAMATLFCRVHPVVPTLFYSCLLDWTFLANIVLPVSSKDVTKSIWIIGVYPPDEVSPHCRKYAQIFLYAIRGVEVMVYLWAKGIGGR
jgi:hypothetical protein